MRIARVLSSLTLAVGMAMTALAADSAPKAPELLGYCPFAYVAAGKAIKGSPDHASMVDGKNYWFANADAKKAYDAAPGKYQVACDGYCAYAAAKGAVFPGDPTIFSVKDGVIYFFINQETKAGFDADAGMSAKAVAMWPELAKQQAQMKK